MPSIRRRENGRRYVSSNPKPWQSLVPSETPYPLDERHLRTRAGPLLVAKGFLCGMSDRAGPNSRFLMLSQDEVMSKAYTLLLRDVLGAPTASELGLLRTI
jgi:hypothetical protein